MKRRLAVLALAILAACTGISTKTANYANMTEARPAVEQGLLPSGLPSSAVEIRAAYVPDGWQRWGIINFPSSGADELRALLQAEEISLSGIRCEIPSRIEWWPVQLRRDLDDERVKATGAKAYRSRTGNWIFVVNWPQGRAYFWTVA